MLEPQSRLLFSEALRPPEGYELSWAIGTTYTLDLVAAVAAPLAFALFDWEQEEDRGIPDPIPLLEALRRYADKMTVFVQAGHTAVPKPQQFLLSYLDDSVIEASAPTPGGLFHPKVWVLRFAAADQPVQYRFACLSRNLTFDRCWDTAIVIEGTVIERRTVFSRNRPLSDFVAALPNMAVRTPSAELRRRIRTTQQEILLVDWTLPPSFSDLRFWPMGIDGHRRWPFSGRVDRMLVVSPFVGGDALEHLSAEGEGNVLVSRLETLQEVEGDVLEPFENIYVLDEAADIDARSAEEEEGSVEAIENVLQGLHAKLYVADAGWRASVWTGSANATGAGLGPNVEFLVELEGTKPKCGIDALLARGSGEAGFGDLLKPYLDHEYRPPDEVEEALRAQIEKARLALVQARLIARVQVEEEGRFEVALRRGQRTLKLPPDVAVRIWPVMLAEAGAVRLGESGDALARFELAGEELSSLFAFSVEARTSRRKREERFVLNLKLEGAPEDRREYVLRSVLKDRNRVMRFLLFLLADGDPQQAAALLGPGRDTQTGGDGEVPPGVELPLFESLLRALEREPSKLDHVSRVITDLRKTPEGESLIPEGFEQLWVPIWEAREAMR